MTGPDGNLKVGQVGVILPDHLTEGGLDPVKDIGINMSVQWQGEDTSEELRGNLVDGRMCPQLIQFPNELQREEAGSPCANLMEAVIRLSHGLLCEVFKVFEVFRVFSFC